MGRWSRRRSVGAGRSTDLITRRSCIASNASRQPSSGARRPTIVSGQRHAAIEQMDHALPDRVVVAERSLQPDVAEHQRVDVDRDDVGRPADLGHLAVRPGQLQRRLRACRLAPDASHTTSAPSGDQPAHHRPRALSGLRCRRCASRRAARAVSSRARVAGRPTTISGLAPASAAIRAHSRPIGPGPRTTTASPGRIVEFTHIAL